MSRRAHVLLRLAAIAVLAWLVWSPKASSSAARLPSVLVASHATATHIAHSRAPPAPVPATGAVAAEPTAEPGTAPETVAPTVDPQAAPAEPTEPTEPAAPRPDPPLARLDLGSS